MATATCWRALATAALLATALLASATDACPGGCNCMDRSVWCVEQGLTALPAGMPVSTRHLYLFHNNITALSQPILSKLKNLQTLELTSNQLTSNAISARTFRQLPRLQTLVLNENKLTNVRSDMFAGMRNLMRLYLEDNSISRVDPGAFANMTGLLEVKLSGNRLSSFPKMVGAPALRRLCLGRNRIARLPNSFQPLNLHELELGGNQLRQLAASTFSRTNLLKIDLSDNRLTKAPAVIRNMTSLQTMNLSGNPIEQLPRDLLVGMRGIKVVDLSRMRLRTLEEGFIPTGVWPNVVALARNPWNCQCALGWLLRMMRSSEDVFTDLREVECEQPRSLQDTPIIDLSIPHLRCATNTKEPSNPLPRPRAPTVDGCDALACANGAKCVRNATNYLPQCECKKGWRGLLCDRPSARPTTTTTPTLTTTTVATTTTAPPVIDLRQPVLLIDRSSVTAHSVRIVLPSTGKRLRVSVTDTGGDDGARKDRVIVPSALPYTVRELRAGRRYNICISSMDHVGDALCGSVATADELPVDREPEVVAATVGASTAAFVPTAPPAEDDGAAGVMMIGGGPNDPVPLIYPLVGATLCAFVILVVAVMFYMCHRHKRKAKEAARYDRPGKYGDPETEMVPLAAAGSHSRPQPLSTAPEPPADVGHRFVPTVVVGQEMYQMAPLHDHVYPVTSQPYRVATPPLRVATPPSRVTTPNRNGSLARSSVSGGSSVAGAAGSGYDGAGGQQTRACSPLLSAPTTTRCEGETVHVYATLASSYPNHYHPHQPEMLAAYQNNRTHERDYQPDQRRMVPAAPVRSSCTSVNQLHQAPIVATTTYAAPYLQMNHPRSNHHHHGVVYNLPHYDVDARSPPVDRVYAARGPAPGRIYGGTVIA